MSKKYLIVTAHPDDESIFFSGLIQNRGGKNFTVLCVTDGNADGKGSLRKEQFLAAMKLLKISNYQTLSFPDIYEKRLDVEKLNDILKTFQEDHEFDEVFTHGVLGEYGHPHHQDVSFAVHRYFKNICPVWSIAYNCFPDMEFKLSKDQFNIKTKLLSDIYLSETKKFIHLIQACWYEGFINVEFKEVEALYNYFLTKKKPDLKLLSKYTWFWTYLIENGGQVAPRPF